MTISVSVSVSGEHVRAVVRRSGSSLRAGFSFDMDYMSRYKQEDLTLPVLVLLYKEC